MKAELSSFDLYFLVKEFQVLIDAKVQKIFEETENKKNLLFDFHLPNVGRKFLRINLPGSIYFTDYKGEYPATPPGYCMFLRKYLNSARIREVKQHEFERILEIVFERKEGKYILIIELFSKGNLILLKEDYTIMSPLENQGWHDRTIRGGIKYDYPPAQVNILKMSEKDFDAALKKSDKDSIVKTLAVDLGFGGLYAEELCAMAGVDKSSHSNSKELFVGLQKLLSHKISPVLIEGQILPFQFESLKGEAKAYDSFNEALDENLSHKILNTAVETRVKEKKTAMSKIQKIISEQEKQSENCEKGAAENQRKGEIIFENYQLIKEVLEELNKARQKFSWQEIKEKVKGHKTIKKIDEKNGEIIIEV